MTREQLRARRHAGESKTPKKGKKAAAPKGKKTAVKPQTTPEVPATEDDQEGEE